MAARKPLVINAGQYQELQTGDTLDLTAGVSGSPVSFDHSVRVPDNFQFEFGGSVTCYAGSNAAQSLYAYANNTLVYTLTATAATWHDGYDFVLGTTTGTKVGTSTSQKLGFFGATPISQPASAGQAANTPISSAGSGTCNSVNIDTNFSNLATEINAIRLALVNLGLIKGSA